jgi:hypothetical protein
MEEVLSPNKISGYEAIAKIRQQDRPQTAEVDEVVAWMAAEIERTGYLDHNATAHAIWEIGHPIVHRTYVTDKHGKTLPVHRLHPDIVKAFERRMVKTVVAEKDHRARRKRKSPMV